MSIRPNIAVVSYNREKYSETFIRAQAELLSANVHYLYGGELPKYYGNGKPFVRGGVFEKLAQAIQRQEPEKGHLKAIEKYFLQNDIQLVLANYAVTAFPIMEICEQNNIPLIVHFHGWTAYRQSIIEQYKGLYPILFKIASAIIVVSLDMKRQVEFLGAPSDKVHVMRCGADERKFTFSEHTGNAPIFFSPGRFCPTKNPQLTIRAFAKVLQQVSHAKLIFAGSDEGLLAECNQLVKDLNLQRSVVFCEPMPHQEIAVFMKQCIAIVQHSATTTEGEKEGTPVTLLEAALSGLPIVSTNHAGIGEVFKNGESALLCQEYNWEEMADKMLEIVINKDLAEAIARNAYKEVREKYTLSAYIAALNNLITKNIS